MRVINIGLLGFGTVGAGVAKLLFSNKEIISKRLGAELNLKSISDPDLTRDRGIIIPDGILTNDSLGVVADPDIDIIVELIGGVGIAKELVLKAIEAGKHIVTANKALIAMYGDVLRGKITEAKIDFAYEASVGGCMPVIKALRESLAANRINEITGILNGTCNYILSMITNEGLSFDMALRQAQDAGFAEADPSFDIEGKDTAHKLAILAGIAYGTGIDLADIHVEGITSITPMDIELAREMGYRIKLLAITKNHGDSVELRVHPTMIPKDNILSNVEGSLNAVSIDGDAVGNMLLYGHGAGMMPTASAILSDVIDVARNILSNSIGRIPTFAFQSDSMKKIQVLPMGEIKTCYYVRFAALDKPGVLSRISGALGDFGISIDWVHQRGRHHTESVPIVMLTHVAKEADFQKALAVISAMPEICQPPLLVRVEDDELL
ncbi:homoserine dehydrogenase [Desulforegula conservatrix]|uniref:homoserine dehydrogenase n=1 Tax=Desulforegula conservatrix TaxID=153026 RepID=UPI00042173BB|nr:homoserine dehydrogenase [Desulforegula conservatrix]